MWVGGCGRSVRVGRRHVVSFAPRFPSVRDPQHSRSGGRQEKTSTLSQLSRKQPVYERDIRTEENFEIALDFALYNWTTTRFDCDPHETDALYDTLERRLN